MRAASLWGAVRARHASPLLLLGALSAYGACAIQGVVVSSLSGRAVPRAQVFARTHADEAAVPVRQLADYAGRFCFEHLEAGDYEISANRFGYLDAGYGQKRSGGPRLVLRISAGQALQPLIVKMTPQARISGTLVDSDGDPIEGGEIQLLKRVWMNGKFQSAPVTLAPTDDQGRFQLAQLAPGTYYLSARPRPEFHRSEVLDAKGEPIREREVETYYGGSLSVREPSPIALKAGEQITGLTLSLQKAGGRHVSGRISVLLPEGDSGVVGLLNEGSAIRNVVARARIKKDGSFRMDGVTPGEYRLWGHIWHGGSGLELEKRVDLTNGDADGIVLEPVQQFEIVMRVRVEGARGSKVPPIQQLYLTGDSRGGTRGELQRNGTYKFGSVSPGVYQIWVGTDGEAYFVKRVIVDGDLRPGRRLDLRGEKPKSIEVILSSQIAAVQGQVAVGHPLTTGVMIILRDDAESGDTRSSEQRAQAAGPNGEFAFKSVPPGKYRLYALEDFDQDLWGSPELAAMLVSKSVAVELHEGEKQQVMLPLISAKELQDAARALGL